MAKELETEFARFASSYRSDRYRLWWLVGKNARHGLAGFFVPFRDWDQSHVIGTEVHSVRKSLEALRTGIGELDDKKIEALSEIALAAKNRAEKMSAKSDFYPVYSALIAVTLAVFGVVVSEQWVRVVAAGGVIFFVFTSALIRVSTREQVAYLKELGNLLDHIVKFRR